MMSRNLQGYYTLKCLIRDLLSNIVVSPKFWLAKDFALLRSQGNETSTNIVWYLYSFHALFVLYEAELDNNITGSYFKDGVWSHVLLILPIKILSLVLYLLNHYFIKQLSVHPNFVLVEISVWSLITWTAVCKC